MLSYRHGFHAGNFADVFKHVALCQLLRTMQRKEKGFLYLETHAGAGRYDLHDAQACLNKEYADGIGRLWEATDAPDAVGDYLTLVHGLNPDGALRYYPGSPQLACLLKREQDRIELCELHPTDYRALTTNIPAGRRVHLQQRDGLAAMKALLPPPERRGLIHIDPAYELAADYTTVFDAVVASVAKWPGGVYAVWYPILSSGRERQFVRRFAAAGFSQVLHLWLQVRSNQAGMYGCGIVVINPPWRFDSEMAPAVEWLTAALGAADASCGVEWLTTT